MKKVVVSIGLILIGGMAFAAGSLADVVSREISRQTATMLPSNSGAINQNKTVEFRVKDWLSTESTIYDGSESVLKRYDVGCKAYALHANWLLLAGTCARPMAPAPYTYLILHELEPHDNNHLSMQVKYNNQVMLVWHDKPVYTAPFINVLAVNMPARLFALSADHGFRINSSRFGINAVLSRTLKAGSVRGNRFELNENWTSLSGTATDPLFAVSAGGQEFLVGYNDGIMDYQTYADGVRVWDGRTSNIWYSLTAADLQFIKQIVLNNRPQDWPEIKMRLFLDTTNEPYFK